MSDTPRLAYIKKELKAMLDVQWGKVTNEAMNSDGGPVANEDVDFTTVERLIKNAASNSDITRIISKSGLDSYSRQQLAAINGGAPFIDGWTNEPLPGMPAGFMQGGGTTSTPATNTSIPTGSIQDDNPHHTSSSGTTATSGITDGTTTSSSNGNTTSSSSSGGGTPPPNLNAGIATWASADDDNDGVSNGTEYAQGTYGKPNTTAAPSDPPVNLNDGIAKWAAADDDNDGVSNGTEYAQGTYGKPNTKPPVKPPVHKNPSAPGAPMFTLIQSEETGAIYVLNNRNERFHITPDLMNDMKAGGSWSDPKVESEVDISQMALRYDVGSIRDLSTINNATVGDNLMLMKGDAAGNPDNTVLAGNGNAVYAVDTHGNRFHVTENAYNQLTNQNGGVEPVVGTINQAGADSGPLSGSLEDNGGVVEVESDDPQDIAVQKAKALLAGASAPPSDPGPNEPSSLPPAVVNNTPPEPTDETLAVGNSSESTGAFNFVRNDADGAIYAVNAHNQKFHISPELWGQLSADQQTFQATSQAEVDAMQNGSTVALTNMDQLRSINIGAGNEYKLVKGTGGDLPDDQLAGNGRAVYALTSDGDRYHVTADLAAKLGGNFSNIDTLNQTELDNLGTYKGDVKTIAELNNAVKDQSGAASGFDGDTSGMPNAIPPVQGYSDPH